MQRAKGRTMGTKGPLLTVAMLSQDRFVFTVLPSDPRWTDLDRLLWFHPPVESDAWAEFCMMQQLLYSADEVPPLPPPWWPPPQEEQGQGHGQGKAAVVATADEVPPLPPPWWPPPEQKARNKGKGKGKDRRARAERRKGTGKNRRQAWVERKIEKGEGGWAIAAGSGRATSSGSWANFKPYVLPRDMKGNKK